MSVALITGTSTGIGLATAVTLARAGHSVHAAMRDPDGGGGELRELAAAETLPLTIVRIDVDDDASVAGCIAQVLAAAGRIDVLVNNAGIGGGGAVEEVKLADVRQTMETNFFGPLRCIQAALPGMRQQQAGCIVNISSIAGRIAAAPQAPYAASKWALEALGEVLAQEVKPFNIRVALIEPGIIATPIFKKGKPPREDTLYPHARRFGAMARESLKTPVSPYVVAERIREIVDGDSWRLRYLVGADAEGIWQRRQALSDEEWIALNAVDDEEWLARMKRERGLDIEL
jgi:NAD(P)-dependent dehydrogenase (short-subunit alcohol dehydrogenase family)